jgi:hypothetical protein
METADIVCVMLCQDDTDLTDKEAYKRLAIAWNQIPYDDRSMIMSNIEEFLTNKTPEPVCHLVEQFNDDGDSIGFFEASPDIGFPVFSESSNSDCESAHERRASHNQPNLVQYSEEGENQWITISEIHVPTEYDKEQLLMAIQYLHDCYINTDLLAVNSLVHLYQNPERIIVDGTQV